MASPAIWDYIVVGSGPAGTVVSSRLLQYDSSARILLIEAGPDVNNRTDILYANSTNLIGGDFDWKYNSTRQTHLDGREISIPAGRCLGGGSGINLCVWFRGAKADWDDWAHAVGDEQWNYDNLLPYFRMTEEWFHSRNPEQHGVDGKLRIESTSSSGRRYPLEEVIEESLGAIGVSPLPDYDYNVENNIGLGELHENRRNGARQLASLAYSLKGVTVLTDTLVESVLLDKTDALRATGVRLANGTELFSKEVIVSAGAYRTPQLLMLSGIGPADVLERHDIEVKLDAPEVGKNFSDHLSFLVNWKLRDPSKGYAIGSANPLFLEPQFGLGMPVTSVALTPVPREGLEAAIAADEGPVKSDHYLLKSTHAMMESFFLYVPSAPLVPDGTHVSTFMMALKPTSRGTVSIKSKNPADPPLLDPNYLGTEVDRYVWRTALRSMVTLMAGPTALGRDIIAGETPPNGLPPITLDSSDEYLESRLRTGGGSTFHGMGSCAMGKVVDSDLRVKGVHNLRIVDASVFPVAMGSHIQAAVYALAPALDPTMDFVNIYKSAQVWTNNISLLTEAASFLSTIKNCLSSAWESFRADLSLPHVYWALIATPALIMYGKNGFANVTQGSLAAAFQSSMYGGFTPAGGLFATLTSLGMLGFLAPAITIIAAVIAFLVAVITFHYVQD
ncbi:hypothetical protein DL771_005942 [Monosporascus sp. 5C6A]|nr:hypothetical protein DL771_005942 [Monosporascus sp. 5C6A]